MTLKDLKPGEQKIRVISGVIEVIDLKKAKNTKDGVFYPVKIKEDNPNLIYPNIYDVPEGVAGVLKTMEGETVVLDLKVDRVKNKKEDDGQISSYYWSVKGVHHPDAGEASADVPDSDPEDPPGDPTPPVPTQSLVNPWPKPEGAVQGLMEKLAGEWFFGMMTQEVLEMKPEAYVILELRRLRNELYWGLKESEIEPKHYCWEHDTPFLYSRQSDLWGHQIDGAICYRDGDPADPADQEEEEPDWNAVGRKS